jgi:hypothetical protein
MAGLDGLCSALLARGITRGDFLKSSAAMSAFEARDGGIALDSLVIVSKQDVDELRAEALATALRTGQ